MEVCILVVSAPPWQQWHTALYPPTLNTAPIIDQWSQIIVGQEANILNTQLSTQDIIKDTLQKHTFSLPTATF